MTDLAVGQRWTFKGQQQAVPSTLLIGEIETKDGATVVHISVENFASPTANEPISFGHLPFSHEAVAGAVLELLETEVVIDERFQEGYAYWREQQGGVFTLPVIEALESVVEANASRPEPDDDGFDAMVQEMRAAQSNEMIDNLYRTVLALPQWYFICDPYEQRAPVQWTFPDGPNPEPAVLVFTSQRRATLAADELGLYEAGTDVPLMQPSVAEAVQWIASDGFANGWLCFNLTRENFPFYADELVTRYNALRP